jgi:endonuclease-3
MVGASGRGRRRHLFALLERIAREVPEAPALLRRLRSRRRDPLLRLLVGTVLSHQTTAPQARRATARLWRRYRGLHRLALARPDEIRPLIDTVGLGRLKARRLVALARAIEDRWGSVRALGRFLRTAPLPQAWRALLALPGIGPKSAAVVLLFRFGRPVFPVDTNILRVARQLGWVSGTAGPEDVRLLVERILAHDPRLLLKAHAYLLALGRATARGRRPELLARLEGLKEPIRWTRPV